MAIQSSDHEITEGARAWQRRVHVPIAYFTVLAFPVAADLLRIPIPHALLWPMTWAVFAVAIGVRTFTLLKKPNPAASLHPMLLRQELLGASRRRLIVTSSLAFALILLYAPYAATPVKGIVAVALAGIGFGAGAVAFLLNLRIPLSGKTIVLQDHELNASLLSQATKWSGLIVLPIAVASLPAVMLRPEAARPVLSVVLWTACEAPLLIFAWLEYRIERNA